MARPVPTADADSNAWAHTRPLLLLAATETGQPKPGNWVGFLFQNAAQPYASPNVRVDTHHIAEAFFRSSHLRSPGRIENSFANEGFADEMAAAAGIDPAERRRRAAELIERVGLQRDRKRQLREYSKGMRQRIGLAQALINNPKLVILDEPTSGLDPKASNEFSTLLKQLQGEGAAPARRRGVEGVQLDRERREPELELALGVGVGGALPGDEDLGARDRRAQRRDLATHLEQLDSPGRGERGPRVGAGQGRLDDPHRRRGAPIQAASGARGAPQGQVEREPDPDEAQDSEEPEEGPWSERGGRRVARRHERSVCPSLRGRTT